MPSDPGPLQTDSWPLTWGDLDQLHLPSWVVWQRMCQQQGADGKSCPRRMAGAYFGVRYCDLHWPTDIPRQLGKFVG